MTDYTKLIEALRILQDKNSLSYYKRQVCKDAAAAIEELTGFLTEAERDRDEYEERMRKEQERVIKLQAEVERLKDSNEELREKQTYIDHYGNKWMTSAKDVPTSAYEHGYADGLDEAMAKAMAKMEVQE